jgi:nitrite reductase (NO-forming)
MSITKEPARYGTSNLRRIPPSVERVHTNSTVGPVAAFRTIFGLVWVVDAVLKWLPGFRDGFGTMLHQAANNQPTWLRPMFDLWTDLPRGATTALAYASAATETFLALALIAGFARKSVYLLGAAYSLMIWAMGEGFGAPYQSGSTDVGAALIYTFVFAALFLMDRSGPNTCSLDFYLEKRISWWHRVADVGSRRPRTRSREEVGETSVA